jgi:hypothetical protein
MRKYSEEFVNNSDILKDAIIGLEFEFYIKELSFYKTLELLNKILSPVKVHGFKHYHPDMKPDTSNFLLTPDLSGGSNMVEVITGPMPYFEAKFYLISILKFIQEYGYTNEKASIHFNISFKNKDLTDLNILKMILNTDEDEIYRSFPTRKNNVYAKSIKRIIPFKEYDYNNIPIDVVKNNIRVPEDKYYGINLLHINKDKGQQRLEFRYIGGKDYEKNIGELIYFMDKFILNVSSSVSAKFTEPEIVELEKHLDTNISNFKSFSTYDNFLIAFPTISLQVDQQSDYNVVNAYYNRIYNKLFLLIESTENLKNCIFNWLTAEQRLEIVDGNVKCIMNVNNFDFINCILEGIFDNCKIVNSQISDSQLLKCEIVGSNIKESKVLNSVVDNSEVKDSFFMNGYFNGNMDGGVFRSGKLGQYANISSTTKIVTDGDNFFDTKFGEDDKKDKGKENIKGFGK